MNSLKILRYTLKYKLKQWLIFRKVCKIRAYELLGKYMIAFDLIHAVQRGQKNSD